MRYILASVMHFKRILLVFICCLYLIHPAYGELVERVVAIVDDEAITLSEFKEAYQRVLDSGVAPSERLKYEVLDRMINRFLLLREAERIGMRRSGEDDDTLLREYIDRRIRAFIHIPFKQIEDFYRENKDSFGGKEFHEVRSEIERYLTEKELNRRLIKHIKDLRARTYIRIQLE